MSEARGGLPPAHRFSAGVLALLNDLAAKRGALHRDLLYVLVPALFSHRDGSDVGFWLSLLPDAGFAVTAIDALDRLDPALVAAPLRAWLAEGNAVASTAAHMFRALRAKTDLAVPRDEGDADAVGPEPELLELWLSRGDFVALRLALARGLDANTAVSFGETVLQNALDAWANAEAGAGEPFSPRRDDWLAFIGALFAAGADPDRKLVGRFRGRSDLEWKKGLSARRMLEYVSSTSFVPSDDCDRLAALFPAVATAPRAKRR